MKRICRPLATFRRFCQPLAKPLQAICQSLAIAAFVCQTSANILLFSLFVFLFSPGGGTAAAASPVEWDVADTPRTRESVEWIQGDTVELAYRFSEEGEPFELTAFDSVVWSVVSVRNMAEQWIGTTGTVSTAEASRVDFALRKEESNLPEGSYWGFLRGLAGTEAPSGPTQKTLLVQGIRVRPGPDDNAIDMVLPVLLAPQVAALAAEVASMELATNAALIAECVGQVETNTAAIADLQTASANFGRTDAGHTNEWNSHNWFFGDLLANDIQASSITSDAVTVRDFVLESDGLFVRLNNEGWIFPFGGGYLPGSFYTFASREWTTNMLAGYATTGEVASAIAAATNHAVEAANVRFDLSGSPDGDKFAFWKYTGWSDGKGHYGLGYTNGVLVPSAPTPDLPTGIGTSNFVFVAIVSNYNTGSDTSYRWTNLGDISPDMTGYATTEALAEAVAPLADTNWVAEYVAEHAPSGGGTWEPTYRIVTQTNDTVLATDWLIWMDSEAAEDTQILDLPDMTNASLTVIVRHLGNDHPTILRRATETATNTYQLTGDGASVAVDWLGARNTWYWRQAY